MDNVEILRIMLAILILMTILLSFILSLIIFRISLESDDKTEKEIKNRRERNDRWRSKEQPIGCSCILCW